MRNTPKRKFANQIKALKAGTGILALSSAASAAYLLNELINQGCPLDEITGCPSLAGFSLGSGAAVTLLFYSLLKGQLQDGSVCSRFYTSFFSLGLFSSLGSCVTTASLLQYSYENNLSQFPAKIGLSLTSFGLSLLPLGYSFFSTALERRQLPQTSIQDQQEHLLEEEEGDIEADGDETLINSEAETTEGLQL